MTGRLLLLAFAALLGVGCTPPSSNFQCETDADCADDYGCAPDGTCELLLVREPDAGRVVEDAGRVDEDAGRVAEDAGRVDEDAGPVDVDAGLVDAGPVDVDAGLVDAGALDAGGVDAGAADAGPVDVDAGFDAGPETDAGCLPPDPGHDWWDNSYAMRARVALPLPPGDELSAFPLYVPVPEQRATRFRADGFDFQPVTHDGVALPAEREVWAQGQGFIQWVLLDVPALETGDEKLWFWVYASSPGQGVDPSDATTVWQDYQAVWHMGSTTASVGPSLTPTGGDLGVGSPVGLFHTFNGANERWELPASSLLQGVAQATLTAWFRPTTATGVRVVASVGVGSQGIDRGSRMQMKLTGVHELTGDSRSHDEQPGAETVNGLILSLNNWHYASLVTDFAGGAMRLDIDGGLGGQTSVIFPGPATSDTLSKNGAIGAEDDGGADRFKGDIGEVRVSAVARSAEWTSYESQTTLIPDFLQWGPWECR